MDIEGWQYYNHAAIPACAPHEQPDLLPIKNKTIWKIKGYPLLARWTTDFDCGYVTNWWYMIKDTPFDISGLKAKRRYEIRKGTKNFIVREIKIEKYKEELFYITVAAYEGWAEKYRPKIDRNSFIKEMEAWKGYHVFGAFERENEKLCGYAVLERKGRCINFLMLRTEPKDEKKAINAAIVYRIMREYEKEIEKDGVYICDGERSISHETAFQDYLEKYFGFRKAYCIVHRRYRRIIKIAVGVLYPYREYFKGKDNLAFIHKINSILKMEEIIKGTQKKNE